MLGPLGTNLLLLLCGFWITVSLRKPTFELGPFLRNRLVRIYVPYIAVVLLSYSAWALMPQLGAGKGGWGLESTLSNLLLIPGLFPDRPALTVAWTLSYVVAAYLTIPLLARFLGGGMVRRIALWITLTSLPFLIIASGYSIAYRIAYIPLGCLLAEVYTEARAETFAGLKPAWLLGGMLLLLTVRFELLTHRTEFAASPNSFLVLVFATGAGLATLSMVGAFRYAADSQPAPTFSSLKTLEWIGQRGYSIYLFHGPVTKLVIIAIAAAHWTGPLAMLGVLLISGALTLVVAALSHQWLESTIAPWVSRRLAGPPHAAFANSL